MWRLPSQGRPRPTSGFWPLPERPRRKVTRRLRGSFASIAAAEAVHAKSHFELLEKVGSTEENLKLSFEKETFVNEVAYPAFLKQAWADEDKLSIWYFTKARNAEERHAHLYKLAISDMASDRETKYFVCSYCGWVETLARPEKCPNCGRAPELYNEIK